MNPTNGSSDERTKGFELRLYTARDEGSLAKLWSTVFSYEQARNNPRRVISERIRRGNDGLLVAVTRSKEVVGSTMFGYDGFRGWLYRVAVSPEFRGRGIARALVAEAERRLLTAGCSKVNLQVHANNDKAAAFWEHLGFAREPRISLGKELNVPSAAGSEAHT